ncbi:hypothetical protein B0H17DRAFT_863850, partial [Mycena rosella]
DGVVIKPSKAVKLVGIWLDEKLTFQVQGTTMLMKGHEWLVTFHRLAKVSRGVALAYMWHLYLSICLLRMFYSAEVSLALIQQCVRGANRRQNGRGVMKKLGSVQLRAARLIVGGMVSSPGNIRNAHTDLIPIHLAVDK